MPTSPIRRGLAIALAAAFAVSTPVIALSAPADPGPVPDDVEILSPAGDWTRFAGPYGFVYGQSGWFGDEIFVIANGSIEDACGLGVDLPPAVTGRLRQRTDGRWVLRDTVDQQTVFTAAYAQPEGIDDIFQWFGVVCPALFGGEAAPEVLASGQAEISFDSVMESPWWFTFEDGTFPQPKGRYSNGVEGILTTPANERVRLVAEVKYDFDPATGLDLKRGYLRLKPIG